MPLPGPRLQARPCCAAEALGGCAVPLPVDSYHPDEDPDRQKNDQGIGHTHWLSSPRVVGWVPKSARFAERLRFARVRPVKQCEEGFIPHPRSWPPSLLAHSQSAIRKRIAKTSDGHIIFLPPSVQTLGFARRREVVIPRRFGEGPMTLPCALFLAGHPSRGVSALAAGCATIGSKGGRHCLVFEPERLDDRACDEGTKANRARVIHMGIITKRRIRKAIGEIDEWGAVVATEPLEKTVVRSHDIHSIKGTVAARDRRLDQDAGDLFLLAAGKNTLEHLRAALAQAESSQPARPAVDTVRRVIGSLGGGGMAPRGPAACGRAPRGSLGVGSRPRPLAQPTRDLPGVSARAQKRTVGAARRSSPETPAGSDTQG